MLYHMGMAAYGFLEMNISINIFWIYWGMLPLSIK